MTVPPPLRVITLAAACLAALHAGTSSVAAQDSLSIVRVTPAGELRPVSRIDISFSAPIAGRLEGLRDPSTLVRLEPAIAARIVWRDPATIRITPDSALPPGTGITVSVDTFTAGGGARLRTPWSRAWRVRPPAIIAMLPTLSATFAAPLDYDARISILVRGQPDTAALAAQSAFVAPAAPLCAAWPEGRRTGVRVALRTPRADDPYPLRQYHAPRDSVNARFDRIVEITPAEALPEDCALDLILGEVTSDSSLGVVRYRVRSAAAASLSLRCPDPGDCVAARQVELRSAAPVAWQTLRASVRLEPADAFTWPDSSAERAIWSFGHRLRSGDTVRLVVAEEFRDVHGRTVPTPAPFVIPNRIHRWNAQGGVAVTTRASPSPLQVRHVGIDSVRVTLYRGPRDPLAVLRVPRSVASGKGAMWQDSVRYTLPLAASRNEERVTVVPIRLPDAAWRVGLLGVRAEAVGYDPRFLRPPQQHSWVVQHSDLAVHARVHESGGAAFVTDANGAPVRGAVLRALNGSGREVARARTDRNGLARLESAPVPASAKGGPWPFAEIVALEVSRGRDRLLAPIASGPATSDRVGYGGSGNREPLYQHGLILTDRDLFRPGERIHATAILREGWSDALHPVRNEPVRWRVLAVSPFGEEGTVIATSEQPLSAAGVASDSFSLPATATLGQYTLSLERRQDTSWQRITSRTVQVSEYRPQELNVGVRFDRTEVVRGDTLHATFSARLLLDAPLADAPVEWFARFDARDPWGASADGLPRGWSTGDPFSESDDEGETGHRTGALRTEANGDVRLELPTAGLSTTDGAQVTLVASVREITGQVVTAQATATVRGSSRRVALQHRAGWSHPRGREVKLRFGVVDRDGRWVDGLPLRVSVLQRRIEYLGERGMVVTLDTLERVSLVSRDSSGTISYVPTALGQFGIVVESEDDTGEPIRASLSHYITPSDPDADSTAFPMSLSADSAQVNDEITVRFDSPWPDAEAWAVVARDRLIHHSRVRETKGANGIRLRVDPRWMPRATVSVTLIRRGARPEPSNAYERFRVRQSEIVVSAESKHLRVAVTPLTREVLPGTSTTIDIDVRDATGRPVEGEAVLWAVDEGVLALTNYEVPDPFKSLFLQRAWVAAPFMTTLTALPSRLDLLAEATMRRLGFSSNLQLSQVVVTNADEGFLAQRGAASGRSSPDIRSQFRTTAFYHSRIPVGADGRARVRVSLPDGITTYRLMAVAVDHGDRFGSGVSSLVSTKPLIARAVLPRFVRAADTFQASVAINVRGFRAPFAVTARAQASGAVRLADTTAERASVDSAGARISFDATALRGAAAQFVFSVAGDSLRDAVAIGIPVRDDHSPEARAAVALVRDTTTLRLALPRDIDPARSRLTVRVGASPLPVLRAWNAWLDGERSDFTYRVLFTARGLIAMLRLHAHGAVTPVDSAELRGRLDLAVATLVSRVRSGGRVDLWPGVESFDRTFDAEVGRALLDARDLGVSVPQFTVDWIRSSLQQWLSRAPLLPDTTYGNAAERGRLVMWHLEQRLAVAQLLARDSVASETAVPSNLQPLLAVAGRISFEARAQLAATLPRGPDAGRLLADLWRHAELRGTRVDIPDSVLTRGLRRSRIAPFARLLEATQRHQPDHPMLGALAQRIIQQVSAGGSWIWNGEDYASAIEAIAGFMRSVSATDAAVEIRDGAGRPVLLSEPRGEAVEVERSMDALVESTDRGTDLALSIRTSGAPVYVSVTAHVLRRERPVAPTDNGLAVERWYERVSDGASITEVADGELVRVHLRLSANGAREFVVLEDLLPAGVEVVDPRHRGTGADEAMMLEEQRASGSDPDEAEGDSDYGGFGAYGWYFWWRWNPWDHVERRDDRVVIYSRGLPAGTHEYTYLVRATTAGRFVRPQAAAREYFNPGLGGTSDGGWFMVTPRSP